MAVVGRGREKKAVLEPGGQESEGLAELAVFTERRRHEVVAFVHDQQIPREMGRSFGRRAGGKELLPYVRLPEIVVGRDDPGKRSPRVGIDAELSAMAFRGLTVDHLEGQRELLPEFLLPLVTERGGCENEDATDAAPEQ